MSAHLLGEVVCDNDACGKVVKTRINLYSSVGRVIESPELPPGWKYLLVFRHACSDACADALNEKYGNHQK